MRLFARVGVLALQGDVEAHAATLRALGAQPVEVRAPQDLDGLDHLVLPGGESTTLRQLMDRFGLAEPLARRVRDGELVVLATCAGAILVARDAGGRPPTLGLLDVDVERNAYGTQLDSFRRELTSDVFDGTLTGVFIRAPRITRVGPGVRVLAHDGDDPVLVEGDGVLAATFHPELTTDPFVHERFLALRPRARRHPAGVAGLPTAPGVDCG